LPLVSETDPAVVAYEAFSGIYDEFTSANDYEMWFSMLLPMLEELGLRQGALLDVACGTGRAFPPMLARGWSITACDISPSMIERAREKHPDGIELHVCDMRELPVYGSFELVWALNDPVNYLLGDDDLTQALRAMAANLADGGLIVFDCNTRRLFHEFFEQKDEGPSEDSRWKWEGRGGDGTFFQAQISGEQVEPHLHRERYRPVEEVEAALREVGLVPLGAFGQLETEDGLDLNPDWDEDRDHKILHVARLA
jgi:SAM-dependent methyltransferase